MFNGVTIVRVKKEPEIEEVSLWSVAVGRDLDRNRRVNCDRMAEKSSL